MAADPVASRARPDETSEGAGFEPALPEALCGTAAGDAGEPPTRTPVAMLDDRGPPGQSGECRRAGGIRAGAIV